MKVYRVSADFVDYDEYDAAIILADTPEEALAMFTCENFFGDDEDPAMTLDGEYDHVTFYKHQGEIKIEEVTKKGLALSSFNAG